MQIGIGVQRSAEEIIVIRIELEVSQVRVRLSRLAVFLLRA